MFKKILTYFLLFIYSFGNISVFFVYANSDTINVEQNENSKKSVENKGNSEQNLPKEGKKEGDNQEEKEEGNSISESPKNGEESQKESKGGSEDPDSKTEDNGKLEEQNNDINFTSKIEFQNPSYLLEKHEKDREFYTCDEAKQECKVNLKFIGIVDGEELTNSKYICEVDFGFATGEKNKCNPKTIIFPEGDSEVKYKIIFKDDESIFEEGKILIKNKKDSHGEDKVGEETDSNSNEGGNNGGNENQDDDSTSDGQGDEDNFDITKLPNLDLKIQSGADFSKETEVTCPEKGEGTCKINFTLGEIDENYFSCDFDFGTGKITGQEQKCNPGYVNFEEGFFVIKTKIFEKNNEENFIEKSFTIKNEKPSGIDLDSQNREKDEKMRLPEHPEIQVQSGLSETLTCDKKLCSINLIHKNDNKNLACLWDFGKGDIGKTKINSCNPGYVKFGSGKHEIKLKIYEIGNENNFTETQLLFENKYKIESINAKITLQGKLAKYKERTKDGIICYGKKVCKLNFTGGESRGEIKDWYWDFGNGEYFDGKNPKTVEFTVGKYETTLTVFDENGKKSIERFSVDVRRENRLETKNETLELDFRNFLDAYFQLFINDTNKELIKAKKKKIIEEFRLYYRKNKQYGTTYGKYDPKKTLLIQKKHKSLDGIFYSKDFLVSVGENGKYKEKLPYDVAGKFIIKAYVLDKNLGEVFAEEREIQVKKDDVKNGKKFLEKIQKKSKVKKELKKETKKDEKIIPKITLQGKIGKNKSLERNTITCMGGKTCNINFDGRKSLGEFVEVSWDFGNGKTSTEENPKSIKYEQIGNYTVTLTLRDKFGERYEKRFEVRFIPKAKKKRKTRKRSSKKKTKKLKIGPVQLKIEVQGKIGKNKKLEENTLTCFGTCSVNFDGRNSSGAYKKLFWDFGNGEIFTGENPGYIKYLEYGIYTITLQTTGYDKKKYEKKFIVKFVDNKVDSDPQTIGKGQKVSKPGEYIEKIEQDDENITLELIDIIFIGGIIFMVFSGTGIILRKYKII